MNLHNIRTNFELVLYSGHTLSNESFVAAEKTMFMLKRDHKFMDVFLWGTIVGVLKDYHIAYGYDKDALAGRKLFYTHDYLSWKPLPSPSFNAKRLIPFCTSGFQGDPGHMTGDLLKGNPIDYTEDGERGKGDSASIVPEKEHHGLPTSSTLKEIDRLAATVDAINYEAAIVPRGALLKNIDNSVIPHQGFEGLGIVESAQIKSYQHHREPTQRWTKNLLHRPDYNYALDFLDTLELDNPVNCAWSLQHQKGGALVVLQSLYWPGMTFYHKINTPDYGNYYYGNGKRNIDLLFMLEKIY